jgi:hypothetical protein
MSTERAERLASQYTTQNVTLEDLGQQEGITRERVRQILKNVGISRNNSYRHTSATVQREAAKRLQLERHCQHSYGCSWEELKRITGRGKFTNIRSHPLLQKWWHHRMTAQRKRVEWKISLPEYAELVAPILDRFGLGKHQLVVRRKDTSGPFCKENIEVATLAESSLRTGGLNKAIKVSNLRKMLAAEQLVLKTVEMLQAGHTRPEISKALRRSRPSIENYVMRARNMGLLK